MREESMMGVRPDKLTEPESRARLREWQDAVYRIGPTLTLAYAALTALMAVAVHATGPGSLWAGFVVVLWMAVSLVGLLKGLHGYVLWVLALPLVECSCRINGWARGVVDAGRCHPDELVPAIYFSSDMPRLGRTWARCYVGAARWVRGVAPYIAVGWALTMTGLGIWAFAFDAEHRLAAAAQWTLVLLPITWLYAGLLSAHLWRKAIGGLMLGWLVWWGSVPAGDPSRPPVPVELVPGVNALPAWEGELIGSTTVLVVVGLLGLPGITAAWRARRSPRAQQEPAARAQRRCAVFSLLSDIESRRRSRGITRDSLAWLLRRRGPSGQ